MNEHGDILPYTPMIQIFNLRWYIQHLMDESEEEDQNPLNHENWMKQTNWKFIKYVIHHRHPMTPEQLKQHPQKSQNKILNLTHLLKMNKRQIQLKHFKFIMV